MTTVAPAPMYPDQLLLFGEHDNYPPVHHVSVEFEWISLAEIFADYTSGDLFNWSEWSLDGKRDDPGYLGMLESIREDGFYDPIYLNDNYVNNGHHRIAACVDLGYTHIPFTRDAIDGFDNTSGVEAWNSA